MAAAHAQGVNLSAWVRQAIRQALPDTPEGAQANSSPATRHPREHRAWLTADDRRKLEVVATHLGLRSHTAALRLLIARAQADGQVDPIQRANPGEAAAPAGAGVDALCRSNAELTGLARSLNRLARSLDVQPGHTTVADRWLIERAERDIRAHLHLAASIVASLEPLVPPPPSTRSTRPPRPTHRAAR